MDYSIKTQISLSKIIESYGTQLTGRGNQFKGLCPFHDDNAMSLSVNDLIGKWHCFGCHKSGDIFDFVEQTKGCSKKEAFEIVCNMETCKDTFTNNIEKREVSSLPLPSITKPIILPSLEEIKKVNEILEICVSYWQTKLTPELINKYFLGVNPVDIRIFEGNGFSNEPLIPYGFNEEILRRFRIGYCPSKASELKSLLFNKGYSIEDIAKTGLFVLSKNGRVSAYYKNRIVFPYLNENGKVMYSIGRRTEWTPANKYEPKYKKQLTVGSKEYVSCSITNDHIFMSHVVKQNDWFAVTEGVTDCIAANSNGIPSVSPVTVRFRRKDMEALLELSRGKRVYICNDNEINKSGEKGALDTKEFLCKNGIDARIVTLPKPNGKEKIDLCEYLKDHSYSDFMKLL